MNKYLGGCLAALLAGSAGMAGEGMEPMPPGHHHEPTDAAAISGDSLYQLPLSLETADGATLPLVALRGRPLLVTMFYSHCTSVCPLITAQLQSIDGGLPPAQRAGIRVLMVSLDAQRDTPQVLREFEREHRIDDARWVVARASAGDVQLLAAALGIRYRELPDHSFNHSAVIALADGDGVVRARSVGVQAVDESLLAALKSLGESRPASPPADERRQFR